MRLHGPWRSLFNLVTRPLRSSGRSARETSLALAGLRGRVEVLTDRWGVPHIYADSPHDLFFTQGYVTARDRLFQIDYNRHAVSGRLCELVGRRVLPWRDLTVHLKDRTTLDVDVMLRTFGIAEVARESLRLHAPETRDILSAYAAGVNAFIAQNRPSWEHRLLRIELRPWEAVDSLLMVKGIGFELNYGWRAVLLGALLADHDVPEDVARVIWPHFPQDGAPILKRGQWRTVAREMLATHKAAEQAGLGGISGVGSNCFAVAGSRSKNGDALLANDTHLALTAPVPWHEVHLEGGGFSMHGFALAGVPGVAIGRTPHFAWGITAGLVQDCDLFLEQIHPEDPSR
ncbi:MAG: penicillin acylase family protein, partial [Deltaproteobacteria bacterium]|nr:penicillin acylase family protein [Deltaproteobacteria bacterium]